MTDIEGTYFHVRVLIGMVVGLAIGNLLRGMARVISDDRHRPIDWVQMAWGLTMLGAILQLWWFEIRFDLLPRFTFAIFAFWVCYVLQLFFLTALLMPDNVGDFRNTREYFLARRGWFFGFLALFYVFDFAESVLKGPAFLQALGPLYPARGIVLLTGFLVAIWTRSPVFHGAFAVVALVLQVFWLVRMNTFVF
ncbi:MAG TPA: hypothetical protein PLL32_04785 [Anaeromyxobacteraceae bacterium]|nr:hypothetical protein [Anaeromyxobacteraceae bacterium]